MAALGDDMRFFARESEGEAEGLEADGALLVVVDSTVGGDTGDGGHSGLGVGMVVAGGCRGGVAGAHRRCAVEGGANGMGKGGRLRGGAGVGVRRGERDLERVQRGRLVPRSRRRRWDHSSPPNCISRLPFHTLEPSFLGRPINYR